MNLICAPCTSASVCLWPVFSRPAVSVEALWRLHALPYGEHWIIVTFSRFLHHYRFVIAVEIH